MCVKYSITLVDVVTQMGPRKICSDPFIHFTFLKLIIHVSISSNIFFYHSQLFYESPYRDFPLQLHLKEYLYSLHFQLQLQPHHQLTPLVKLIHVHQSIHCYLR